MSDDTPTQRLPETPDAPDAPDGTTNPAVTGELAEERKKSRALLFTLIGVGGALLIAIIVLLVLLLPRGGTPVADSTTTSSPTASDTPSATPTASDTPSATPAPEPSEDAPEPPAPAPDTAPAFTSFTQTNTVMCNQTNPPGYTTPTVSFSYSVKNASSVWFMMGEGDAADAGAFPMPLSGNQDDVYGSGTSIDFPCGAASQKFTLTIVGQNGQHVHKVFTVVNNGDTY